MIKINFRFVWKKLWFACVYYYFSFKNNFIVSCCYITGFLRTIPFAWAIQNLKNEQSKKRFCGFGEFIRKVYDNGMGWLREFLEAEYWIFIVCAFTNSIIFSKIYIKNEFFNLQTNWIKSIKTWNFLENFYHILHG